MISLPKVLSPQLLKYLIAGGSAFATEYLTFFLLFKTFDAQLYVANSLSFCAGLIVSFSLNRAWAFRKDSFRLKKQHQLASYIGLALCNLLLINVIIGVLQAAAVPALVGKVIAMMTIVVWNFFIFRLFIFAETK